MPFAAAVLAILVICIFILGWRQKEAPPGLRVEDDRLMDGNRTLFIRGAMYFQPHAFHQYFWEELDLGRLKHDLTTISGQGFNAIAVQVNWGSFMTKLDQAERGRTLSEDNEEKLIELLTEAERNNLYTILWFGISRIPEGVEAKFYEECVDAGGARHGPFLGYLLFDYPGIVEEDAFTWQCFVEFHERIARITRGFDKIIYDPLDWQHLNMNAWSWDDSLNLKAWRGFLQDTVPDLGYWNRRWGENNSEWGDVLFPVDSWVKDTIGLLETSHYHGLPILPYADKKWNDFNEWHNFIYRKVAEEITAAIRRANPEALIGQRLDFWRYGQHREETWGVGSVDIYFAGDYPAGVGEANDASALVLRNLNALRSRARHTKPVLFWETGIDVRLLYPGEEPETLETKRAGYLTTLDRSCLEEGLAGWCWWVWRDYYLDEASKDWGLVTVDDRPKAAIAALQRLDTSGT